MALINVDEFRERFDIDEAMTSQRIEPHIGSASRRLRAWVGAAVYDALLAETDPDEEIQPGRDDDSATVNDLKNAEAHLTMHFALLGFNSPLSSKGVVATAMAAEGKEVRRYLTPDETGKLASQYLELAREIASPYIAADDGAAVVIVDGSDDCCLPDLGCEGVTRSVC